MRKSPYRHRVKSHTRAGVKIIRYERGKGSPPQPRKPLPRGIPSEVPSYSVTLFFDKGRETHKVPARTLTDAATQGIRSIQTPAIPRRMRINREGT